MRKLKNILVTGGAGFIGSNFIRCLFGMSASGKSEFNLSDFSGRVVNLDALTYAGNLENLLDVEEKYGKAAGSGQRYFFERGDISDRALVERIFKEYDIDTVVHFAAESHVDRSVLDPEAFVRTNVMGTYTLLDAAKNYWGCSLDNPRDDVLFHHISTDEVYGSLGPTGYFTETTLYDPRSPYSASKASSDHLVFAYHHTFGLPVTLSNCTNNYGPYQFPEKLIPLMILNISTGKNLPVYGEGKNIRDWIYVEDHNKAVWLILQKGKNGQKYNIGGENEWQNVKLLDKLIEIASEKLGKSADDVRKTIVHVKDRPGHDARYAIDCSKIKAELGWKREMTFEQGLELTVQWNLQNKDWIGHIQSGDYLKWVEKNYSAR
ncbi:MAG: dTDP-glucose 4,6-dehydratase [Treponema sp.]|nr:dTDP-glucose 4,6-dehydratase [Treponema sp.]